MFFRDVTVWLISFCIDIVLMFCFGRSEAKWREQELQRPSSIAAVSLSCTEGSKQSKLRLQTVMLLNKTESGCSDKDLHVQSVLSNLSVELNSDRLKK